MKCFFIFAVAAALAAVGSSTSWSQTNGAGGAGGAAGTGAGTTAPGTTAAGGINTNGVSTANTGGAPGVAGAPGTPGAAGNVNAGAVGGVGTPSPAPGVGPANVGNAPSNGATRANVRANVNAARRNANAYGYNNGISATPFFSDPGARRQLNMNDAQYNAMNRAYQDAYARYNQEASKLASNPALTDQQRELQLQQLQMQFNQQFGGAVNSTLTSPQMQTRYNQLNRQFMGYNAFNDPAVRQQLNLTPDQVRQLRTLSNNWRQQLQQFRDKAGNDLGSINQADWARLQQQFATQLHGVLTPEQQQLWLQQTGQPYAFSPNVYFGEQTTSGHYDGNSLKTQVPAPGQRLFPVKPQNAPGTNVPPGTAQGSQGTVTK